MTTDPNEAKQKSRGISADMSPEAVTKRLEICSELSATCHELAKAEPLDLKENAERRPSAE